MLEEFDNFAREVWERSKPPLERMYDRWMGEGNWEPKRPLTRYFIYSRGDVTWRGAFFLAGQPFRCHLCGATDRWAVEGNDARQMARVFVCEHEPIHIGRGAVRQISSVPVYLVGRYKESYFFSG